MDRERFNNIVGLSVIGVICLAGLEITSPQFMSNASEKLAFAAAKQVAETGCDTAAVKEIDGSKISYDWEDLTGYWHGSGLLTITNVEAISHDLGQITVSLAATGEKPIAQFLGGSHSVTPESYDAEATFPCDRRTAVLQIPRRLRSAENH